jgi:hypothetical protein
MACSPRVRVAVFTSLCLVGVALLIAAVCSYVQATRDEALNLQPLSLPVSLVPGTIRTPEFKTDIEYWDYVIAIDFEEKTGSSPRIKCNLGLADSDRAYCQGMPKLIDISWKLFEGERTAAEGNSGSSPAWVSGSTVERTLGRFGARNGHRYTLVLDVKRDASELDVANPKVVVQIPRGYWEDHAMGIGFGKLFAGLSGLVGVTILAGTFAFRRLQRRDQ